MLDAQELGPLHPWLLWPARRHLGGKSVMVHLIAGKTLIDATPPNTRLDIKGLRDTFAGLIVKRLLLGDIRAYEFLLGALVGSTAFSRRDAANQLYEHLAPDFSNLLVARQYPQGPPGAPAGILHDHLVACVNGGLMGSPAYLTRALPARRHAVLLIILPPLACR